jgi:hypothetical protein
MNRGQKHKEELIGEIDPVEITGWANRNKFLVKARNLMNTKDKNQNSVQLHTKRKALATLRLCTVQ